jgi:endonuclease/exonuclease/phosphatase family metal-dependent hydrolase
MTRMVTWLKLRDRRDRAARPILVMNTHFDHVGQAARLESARLIATRAAEMGQGCSIIIMGDFNCDEDDPPYHALLGAGGQGLFDVYRRVHPVRSPNEATFHAFDASATAGNRIDWILASSHFDAIEARIDRRLFGGRPASDHFAVHAKLWQKR